MKTFYMIRYKETEIHANCFPYIFDTHEDAQRFIDEATYYPQEFEVITAIRWKD